MTLRRWQFAPILLAAAVLVLPDRLAAKPAGGNVSKGGATINTNGAETTITQSTDRAIINWHSFDIGQGETTRFVQPGPGSIALNRVTGGGGRSTIDGNLIANGGVWLINPSGVLFGANAQVNVHSLLATTADILDDDFMNATFTDGQFAFATPSTDTAAAILNQGTISIADAGLAALVAPHVRNEGTITGRLATVVLAGANTFTLDFSGDGLLQFDATSTVTNAPDGAAALVENAGTINTPGGTVLLTATAAENVIDNVINSGGIIEARGISLANGRITLDGGSNGRVAVDGTLDVSPGEAGARAGRIDVAGESVLVAHGALLNASDPAGGGAIALTASTNVGIDSPIVQSGNTAVSISAGENVVIRRPIETDGSVHIQGKNIRTEQTGRVTANSLILISSAGHNHPGGGGRVTLITDIRQLAIGKSDPSKTHFGAVRIDNQGNLRVGMADGTGIDVGTIILMTTGTLTLAQPIVASATGDAIVLSVERFDNQVPGQAGLQATSPTGRWLVYSRDPAADVRGGLEAILLYGKTFAANPPDSIPPGSNAFLYAQTPEPPQPPPVVPPPVIPPPAVPPAIPPDTPPVDLTPVLAVATIPINTEPVIQVEAPLASTALLVEPPRLISIAPASDGEQEDPLFASDGNRELWDLLSGR